MGGMRTGRWLPSTRASSVSLFIVVGAMCYLAAITLGASLASLHVADNWTREISSRASLRIDVLSGRDTRDAAERVVKIAMQDDNVLEATLLSREELDALLMTWLDVEELDGELELPAIVDLRLHSFDEQALSRLSQNIARQIPGVVLETHGAWRERVAQARRQMLAVALATLSLVAAIAAAVILLATRAALIGNRSVIELLHLLGARDGDIARAGYARILAPCICASVAAAVLALATFELLARVYMGNSLIEHVTERQAYIYAGWLAAVPLACIAIAMISARIILMRSLARLSRT